MSQENVELFERAADMWNRGDLDGMFSAVWSPDLEFDMRHYEGWPEEPTYRGEKAVRAFLEQWRDTFSDYHFVVERYFDVGPYVVAFCSQAGGHEGTGIAMMRLAQLATVEDGRIVRLANYSDREAALEAVGLRE
jgi:ketosteroid isomerase-like protein